MSIARRSIGRWGSRHRPSSGRRRAYVGFLFRCYSAPKYDYDVRDNLYRREDALGAYTYYKSYDGMRHPLSVTDRNGNVSSYTWDSYGNFLTSSYADGTSTSFTWDSLGRLTSASDSAAGTLTRTWTSVRTYIDKYSTGSFVKGTVQPVWDVNGLPLKMMVLGPDNNALLYSYGFDSAKRFSSESATNQSRSLSLYSFPRNKHSMERPFREITNRFRRRNCH